MDQKFFEQLERLITERTGLELRPREREALRVSITARMAALHLRDTVAYSLLLQSSTDLAEREWDQLIARVTNNESYFFRDTAQMALLRERILPELIENNRERRSLRLWSAGCSTGEEAFSLAIIVEELLPRAGDGADWEIVILGTDIDSDALRQARRGIYREWSFRGLDPAERHRGFVRLEDGRQVAEPARSLVTFAACNLVLDPFPDRSAGLHDMDLILCRNVFIYFTGEAVARVLPKFARTLRDGGYLMTGHAETQAQAMGSLRARTFPGSVVYQRPSEAAEPIEAPGDSAVESKHGTSRSGSETVPAPPQGSRPTRRTAAGADRGDSPTAAPRRAAVSTAAKAAVPIGGPWAETAIPATLQPGAVEITAAHADVRAGGAGVPDTIRTLHGHREPAGLPALARLAHRQAGLGHHEEATECCLRLIQAYPFAAEPYELLAAIAQEQRSGDDAKLLLKKAIYLAPGSPTAYLELGALYRAEGDFTRARKMHITALELLREMPPDDTVSAFGGPPAHEWIAHVNRLLTEGE